jgi:hypothetical protein
MFGTAWVADRYRKRGLIIIFNCAWAIIGVCMMAYEQNPRTRYAGVFLGVSGANANVPSLLSYMHNNIVGQTKRSIGSALLIGGGACGELWRRTYFGSRMRQSICKFFSDLRRRTGELTWV